MLTTRFLEFSAAHPNQPACIQDGESINYGQLREMTLQYASFFAALAGPVLAVGQRQAHMAAAFMACLLAEKTFIPCDEEWPPDRIAAIAARAHAGCLIATQDLLGGALPFLHALRPNTSPASFAPYPAQPDAIAYTIFTSGSTGIPKGVQISRSALDHFCSWIAALVPHASDNIVLGHAPFCFDLSIADFCLSLARGGTMASISSKDLQDPVLFERRLHESGFTTLVGTPTFLRRCLAYPSFCARQLPQLRHVFLCGETLRPETARLFIRHFPGVRLFNAYGPTEATCAVTAVAITPQMALGCELPVGCIDGAATQIFVERTSGGRAGRGQEGEIVLSGPSVMHSYLDGLPANGTYRTGDKGCIKNGFLYFRGRKDLQIKLKGYRIEPGEVESALLRIPNIREAAVVALLRTDAPCGLAAFVVADGEEPPKSAELRAALARLIPRYMLPTHFFAVEALPVTISGKLDRAKLRRMAHEQD